MVAKLFGEEPGQQMRDDLRRFKQVMETGEVVRSDGSLEGAGQGALKQRPAQAPAAEDERSMKATCWMGKGAVEVRDVPDPQILNQRDAIVRITSTAICGSDLHLYNGFMPTMKKGDILGHEFMGEVWRSAAACKNLQGRRPRGRAVPHRLRQLLALPARHAGRCARTPIRTPRWPRR